MKYLIIITLFQVLSLSNGKFYPVGHRSPARRVQAESGRSSVARPPTAAVSIFTTTFTLLGTGIELMFNGSVHALGDSTLNDTRSFGFSPTIYQVDDLWQKGISFDASRSSY